ncbi:MAG: FixH family protein [Silicimonas sp.]|nr:FixH family protein [Silicimonas sp.]
MADTGKPLTGRKVAMIFVACFGVIIAVNLTLAYNAVSTFPGLEVKSSYVEGVGFDERRDAQMALGWDVSAQVAGEGLTLTILKGGVPVEAEIQSAVFGRATSVAEDQFPVFRFDGEAYVARLEAPGDGNWNLRLVAKAEDGTMFKQRVVVNVVN